MFQGTTHTISRLEHRNATDQRTNDVEFHLTQIKFAFSVDNNIYDALRMSNLLPTSKCIQTV
jgi:hypothetical protein